MPDEPFTELEPEEAADLIDGGGLKVIDVRQPYEFAGGISKMPRWSQLKAYTVSPGAWPSKTWIRASRYCLSAR